ncbi:MAG: DUF4333 domain-containing protein [Solirubrobacteraceae bacterium]
MRRLGAIVATALALLLAGCGTLEVIPSGAEKVVRNFVQSRTGYQATNVHCPSGVEAKAGNRFTCHFRAAGASYVAHMVIKRVKGVSVYFQVDTELATGRS